MEMWSLFDFCQGGLLGDARDFKTEYEKPITRGTDRAATERERQVGAATAKALRSRIAPYFLRREKREVLSMRGPTADDEGAGEAGHAAGGGGSGSAGEGV